MGFMIAFSVNDITHYIREEAEETRKRFGSHVLMIKS